MLEGNGRWMAEGVPTSFEWTRSIITDADTVYSRLQVGSIDWRAMNFRQSSLDGQYWRNDILMAQRVATSLAPGIDSLDGYQRGVRGYSSQVDKLLGDRTSGGHQICPDPDHRSRFRPTAKE